jgi:arylsulfatase A-like enzyme
MIGEILYMDGQVRRLLGQLKHRRLYDEALIVFVGDHGEGLMQHGFAGHGIAWNEQLLVPLLIKPPKKSAIRPGRSPALASLVDVLPTMVDIASLPIATDQFDGVSLLETPRRSVLSQQWWSPKSKWNQRLFTLTTERWKYFHYADGSRGDRLYDLAADPYETHDVIDEHADEAAALRLEITRLLKPNDKEPGFVHGTMSDAVREQLRQLGYVE